LKVESHQQSIELWEGSAKQLLHRSGACFKRYHKAQRRTQPCIPLGAVVETPRNHNR
jgi:hypothetical protein